MKLEEQLRRLDALGMSLNEGVTIEDLLRADSRERYEERPFDTILFVFGAELKRASSWQPVCANVWNFDTECIYSTGDYAKIVRRLCEVSGDADFLHDVKDLFNRESRTAWLEYRTPDGVERFWTLRVNDDWADTAIIAKVMIHIERDGKRFYFKDNGQAMVLFFLDEDTAGEINGLADGALKPCPRR